MKLEFSRQIFEKRSHTVFYENLSSGSRVVPSGQREREIRTDGQTDMTKTQNRFSQFCEVAQKLKHPSKYYVVSSYITTDTAVKSQHYVAAKNHKNSGPLKLSENGTGTEIITVI